MKRLPIIMKMEHVVHAPRSANSLPTLVIRTARAEVLLEYIAKFGSENSVVLTCSPDRIPDNMEIIEAPSGPLRWPRFSPATRSRLASTRWRHVVVLHTDGASRAYLPIYLWMTKLSIDGDIQLYFSGKRLERVGSISGLVIREIFGIMMATLARFCDAIFCPLFALICGAIAIRARSKSPFSSDSKSPRGLSGRIAEGMDLARTFRIFLHGFFIEYLLRGINSETGYQALIRLHCITHGCSNDFLSWLFKLFCPPYSMPEPRGVAGGVDGDAKGTETTRILDEMREKGYCLFQERLSPGICTELIDFASSVPCRVDSDVIINDLHRYDPANPIGPKYLIPTHDVITHPRVQDLMADLSLLHLAQEYIGSQPILDHVAMWWSPSYSKTPSSAAAQLYHFDMDRIRWIKFFIYLVDVTSETGPHCFVARSNRSWGKPRALLRHGYARIPDEEIKQYYPCDSFIEVVGPTGTITAVDTCGFHKGKLPTRGHRLVLEFEFSNSLFGGAIKEETLDPIRSDALANAVKAYPRIYSRFRLPLE